MKVSTNVGPGKKKQNSSKTDMQKTYPDWNPKKEFLPKEVMASEIKADRQRSLNESKVKGTPVPSRATAIAAADHKRRVIAAYRKRQDNSK
jgi:hypothetical protein